MTDNEIFAAGGFSGLAKILAPERVLILENSGKQGVLDALIDLFDDTPAVSSKSDLINGIYNREKLMSTGIGMSIAIPHVRLASINDICVAAAVVRNGVDDYESLDSQKVKLIFMIIARENQHALHLRILAKLSSCLKSEAFRNKLINAATPEDFYRLLTLGK